MFYIGCITFLSGIGFCGSTVVLCCCIQRNFVKVEVEVEHERYILVINPDEELKIGVLKF